MNNKEIFMNNYSSLIEKIDNIDLDFVLQFVNYFKSDDIDLYNEFKKYYKNGVISIDNLITLYAKRYDLDPSFDIEQIVRIFIDNVIFNGFSYHLGSSANYDSIMKSGLRVDEELEEVKDYNLLKNTLSKEMFDRLEPFNSDYDNKLFYSNRPIFYSHYGNKPEWIKELEINFGIESIVDKLIDEGISNYYLVSDMVSKYSEKYKNASKCLFLFPNPIDLDKDKINKLLELVSPKEVMSYIYDLNNGINMSTNKKISPNEIMAVDLFNNKISYSNNGEIIEYSNNDNEKTR